MTQLLQAFLQGGWFENIASGLIVMAIELALIYSLVGWMVARAEDRRWAKARGEFRAGVLSHAQTLVRPLAHYVVIEDGKAFVRENIEMPLTQIRETSRRFDSFLSIYVTAIPPEWLSRMSEIADNLRQTADSGEMAILNWREFSEKVPSKTPTILEGDGAGAFVVPAVAGFRKDHRRMLPAGKEAAHRQLFAYHLFRCCDALAMICDDMRVFALEDGGVAALNRTAYFKNRSRLFDSLDAEGFESSVRKDVASILTAAGLIDNGRFYLVTDVEFPGYASSQAKEAGEAADGPEVGESDAPSA